MCGRTSAREVVRVFPRDEERLRRVSPTRSSDWTRKIWSLLDRQTPELWVMVLVALGHSGRRADVGGGDFRTSGRAEETRDASGGAARVFARRAGRRVGRMRARPAVRGDLSSVRGHRAGRTCASRRAARRRTPRRRPRPRYRVARQARHGVAARPRVHPRRGGVPSLVEDARHGVGASSRPPRGARGARHRRRRGRVPPLRAGQAHGGPHGRERSLSGVGERPLPAGADAAAREELAERPLRFGVGSRARRPRSLPSVANAWVTTALVKPPPRTRSLTFGAKSVAARRKNLLYTVKNKSKQEIDLTHEGEALVDHLALNALLLRHAKEKISNEGMYVTIAGEWSRGGRDASCTSPPRRGATRWAKI